ncbi:hypothetical protein N7537_008068 [Penicillium hordei]|uniref:Glycosyltransferase family 28 N-terminal domain-containing protein n=1 Tax=Penicillium hordei TaxID=40994 RepID=A0AAD6DZT9_9EURO|nr:uncharacterized protein N7537_008068 [Penicillium hordei]KAJ5597984.1 hypothetical protein N7537_008068 [Penicillium hordei]
MDRKIIPGHFEPPGDDSFLDHTPPPAYTSLPTIASERNLLDIAELPGDFPLLGDTVEFGANTKGDGRVEIDCNSRLSRSLTTLYHAHARRVSKTPLPEYPTAADAVPQSTAWATKLNIVIQVVGSRGDVQPFIALGTELQRYGHRVRLATHDMFGNFVRDSGLEFYPIGGNPAELMAYMVKNPGLIPSMRSLVAGEIQKKRDMVEEMLGKFWDSCLQKDPVTREPFVADAIIANPPSFAHIHCAQALGVPVHLMFTMPWSSTTAFPHPLANLTNVRGDVGIANYISYDVVEWMTWQGLGDIINKWRKSIDLEEVAMFDGPMLTRALNIPFTYCWSPALVPKPADWPSHIDVCGFFFRDTPEFLPPSDLVRFLDAGPPPVYIGFGSIVLENPDKIVNTILDAVRATGIRAIISKGWSDLAGSASEDVYWIGECPHEWLFQHVSAVVHHGGAGTTACGLKNGKPTIIVPFFGDQPFWGEMVAKAGAGPRPIPHTEMTADLLAEGIRYCLSNEAVAAAASLAANMESERGVRAAVQSFHRQLPLERIRCDLIPEHPAVWVYSKSKPPIKLSKIAAEIILVNTPAESKHMKMYQSNPLIIETTRWDPISGGSSAVTATAVDLAGSVTGIVSKPIGEWRGDRRRRAWDLRSLDRQNASAVDHSKDETSSADLDRRVSTESDPTGSPQAKRQGSLAGRMAAASAKSIGSFVPTALKGMMVDFPLALTEGMKSVPNIYGGTVRDNGKVTDAKSGVVVAGKTFAWGFIDGLGDVVVQPYKGARKEGALGAMKGVGKGLTGLATKSGAGMFGILAYPTSGISKSLWTAIHSGTRKEVAVQRHAEGVWMVKTGKATPTNIEDVVSAFTRLR